MDRAEKCAAFLLAAAAALAVSACGRDRPRSTTRHAEPATQTRPAEPEVADVQVRRADAASSEPSTKPGEPLKGAAGSEATAGLIEGLKSDDWVVREAAAEALGRPGWDVAVPPLTAALKDKALRVRLAAARALGRVGGPAARDALLAALTDTEAAVRLAAIRSLADRPDKALIEPLAKVLAKDSQAEVRAAAAEVLAGIEDPRVNLSLLAALGDGDPVVRHAVAAASGKTPAALVRTIEDKQAAVDALLALLKAPGTDAAMMPWAAEMLGELGDRRAVEPLTEALKHGDAAVRLAAAEALAQMPDQRAASALAKAIWDEDAGVRLAATRSLAKIGPPATEPLVKLLEADDQALRRAAVQATGRTDVQAVVTAWRKDSKLRAEAAKALRPGPASVAPLAQMLKEGDAASRRLAARTLGRVGGKEAAKELVAALEQKDGLLRVAVTDALVGIGPAAVEPLTPATKHADAEVRRAAVNALGQIGGAGAVEPLTAALADADWMVRYRAARWLGQLNDQRAVEPLQAALKDDNEMVRQAAAEALKKLQP